MAIFYNDLHITIYQGHVLDVLKTILDESIHCVVTSPPYWGLRDYGLEPQVWDGDDHGCEHEWGPLQGQTTTQWANGIGNKGDTLGDPTIHAERRISKGPSQGRFCMKCNAWLGSLGLEPSPRLYVRHMVEIFREIRRVLRKDGTVWLNLGDSYAGSMKGRSGYVGKKQTTNKGSVGLPVFDYEDLKPKDLVGVPWRVALALQADGWWLRSDIIWHKPNPMPESVKDRPTKAHEYIFLLSKSKKYFYDYEAIKEPAKDWGFRDRSNQKRYTTGVMPNGRPHHGPKNCNSTKRNKRSVWTIPVQGSREAHFATFPEKLVEPCILAGCSEGGIVLDPFMGSGRTLIVAQKLCRKAIGIELKPQYCEMPIKKQETLHLVCQ